MSKNFIDELRRACAVQFCKDKGLPLDSSSDDLDLLVGGEWIHFRCGFIAGVQFGSAVSSQIRLMDSGSAGDAAAIVNASYLPDGP